MKLIVGFPEKLPPTKITPNPNLNPNTNLNPNPRQGAIFLEGNCPDIVSRIPVESEMELLV